MISPQSQLSDLMVESFLVLRTTFFAAGMMALTYRLRDKRNTQDDPLDEYIHTLLAEQLPTDTTCVKAPGPLITPDIVIMRPQACNSSSRTELAIDLARIVGLEVKKLERSRGGAIARASGMDYNTTPPCGTVRIYDRNSTALDIRGFYLFVCQEVVPGQQGYYRLSALALCDGNLLNADFAYYLSIVGQRTKTVGLGTYGDGANRSRPMLLFANPLGTAALDYNVTLVHSRDDLAHEFPQLRHIGCLRRTVPLIGVHTFHCYRVQQDVPADHVAFDLLDPFPTPSRTEHTQPRGRFRINLQPVD